MNTSAIEPAETVLELITLDDQQRAEKAECERIITAGMRSFLDVGRALSRIHDQRLYLDEFATFEDYCRQKWKMSRSYGYRMIEAAGVAENLSPIVNSVEKILPNESAAREFAKLTPPQQRKVAGMLENAEHVTAPAIHEAAQKVTRKQNGTTPPKRTATIVSENDERLTRAEVAAEIERWWRENKARLLEYPTLPADTIIMTHLVKHFAAHAEA